MLWRTLAAALAAGTAVCSGINSAYFSDRLLSGRDPRTRRIAVAVLALVSLGTLIEALALLATAAGPHQAPVTASASWAAVRLLPFAGALAVSTLIARGAFFR